MAVLSAPLDLIQHLGKDSQSYIHDAKGQYSFAELANSSLEFTETWKSFPPLRLFLEAFPTREFVSQWLGALAAGHMVIPIHPHLPLEKRNAIIRQYQGSTLTEITQPTQPTVTGLGLLTSGTTGEPKIVVLSHESYFYNAQTVIEHFSLENPGRIGIILPLYHSFALITQLLTSLISGGQIFLAPAFQMPGELMIFLRHHQIKTLAGVPGTFKLLSVGHSEPLTTVKHITIAGAALSPAFVQDIKRLFPQSKIWVGYGLTEAGPRVSVISEAEFPFSLGSVGKVMRGIKIKLMAEELLIQSPSLMAFYLDDPIGSALKIQNGWLHSQDIGEIDNEGYIFIQGRTDDIFISGGEKVSPLEIENVLNQQPKVHQAAVFGEVDAHQGYRIAVLLESHNDSPNSSELRRFCRQFLETALVPSRYYWVESLPLTANGKLNRKALATCPRKMI